MAAKRCGSALSIICKNLLLEWRQQPCKEFSRRKRERPMTTLAALRRLHRRHPHYGCSNRTCSSTGALDSRAQSFVRGPHGSARSNPHPVLRRRNPSAMRLRAFDEADQSNPDPRLHVVHIWLKVPSSRGQLKYCAFQLTVEPRSTEPPMLMHPLSAMSVAIALPLKPRPMLMEPLTEVIVAAEWWIVWPIVTSL